MREDGSWHVGLQATIANAAQAMKGTGKVEVMAAAGEMGCRIDVTDRGPGIPPKVAAQIFEPFFTTYEYGTGLGLYLARQMAEANQAALEYVRVAGGGSCFRISLTPPARTAAAAAVAVRA